MQAATPIFDNRLQAGKILADQLADYRKKTDVIVLALSKEGVEVAFAIAKGLNAPMDLVVAKLLSIPEEPEGSFGAVTQDIVVLNDVLIAQWGIEKEIIHHMAQDAKDDARHEMLLYRAERTLPDLANKTVIIADDGMGLGFPMISTIVWAKRMNPKEIVVAVPVGPLFEIERLRQLVDEVVCPFTPDTWGLRIATFYKRWEEPTVEEIRALMKAARAPELRRPRKKTA